MSHVVEVPTNRAEKSKIRNIPAELHIPKLDNHLQVEQHSLGRKEAFPI